MHNFRMCLKGIKDEEKEISVDKIQIHEDFVHFKNERMVNENDIGLLTLNEQFMIEIPPVCLPATNTFPFQGRRLLLTGKSPSA